MKHKGCKAKKDLAVTKWLWQLTAAIIVLMMFMTLMPGDAFFSKASALSAPHKDSLKLLKTASSSMLASPALPKRLHHRFRRDTFVDNDSGNQDDMFYDENYDVIPVGGGDAQNAPKPIGEHISERAEQIAQTFSNMWQSMVDTVKHCVEAIRQLFDGDDYELTPEQEEQLRAAMEARGKAIEEQNEIWRNTYENQL